MNTDCTEQKIVREREKERERDEWQKSSRDRRLHSCRGRFRNPRIRSVTCSMGAGPVQGEKGRRNRFPIQRRDGVGRRSEQRFHVRDNRVTSNLPPRDERARVRKHNAPRSRTRRCEKTHHPPRRVRVLLLSRRPPGAPPPLPCCPAYTLPTTDACVCCCTCPSQNSVVPRWVGWISGVIA